MEYQIPERKLIEEGIRNALVECVDKDLAKSLWETLTSKIEDTIIDKSQKEANQFNNSSCHSLKENFMKRTKEDIEHLQMNIADINSDFMLEDVDTETKHIFENSKKQQNELISEISEQADFLQRAESRINSKILSFKKKWA